jgi:hypothetical protein
VLEALLRRMGPPGLLHDGIAAHDLAAGGPQRGLAGQQAGHVVEVGLVQADAQPGHEVGDLRAVGELLQFEGGAHGSSVCCTNVGQPNVGSTNDSGIVGNTNDFC